VATQEGLVDCIVLGRFLSGDDDLFEGHVGYFEFRSEFVPLNPAVVLDVHTLVLVGTAFIYRRDFVHDVLSL